MKTTDTRRLRRARKIREKIKRLDCNRLSIHMSCYHIYAIVSTGDGSKIITSASTLDKEISANLPKVGKNKNNAAVVGKYIAARAIAAGIKKVAFDRSGYKYHGRVQALAEAARSEGLDF